MKLVLLVTLVRTRSIVSGLHSASNLFSFDLFAYIYLYIYIQIRGLFFFIFFFINRSICWSCLSLVYKGDEGCLLWDRRGPCFRDVFTDEGKRAWELGSDLILSLWWKISIEGKRNKVLYVEYLYTYMFNLEGLIFKEKRTRKTIVEVYWVKSSVDNNIFMTRDATMRIGKT